MLVLWKYRIPMFGRVMLFAVLAMAALPGRGQAQFLFPVLFQIVPDTLPAGGADFTLTVAGANFDSNATVQWNGMNLFTIFLGDGVLQAEVPAVDIAIPDLAAVSVVEPDGTVSNSLTFTISVATPVPVITDTSPSTALAGGPGFDIAIFGTGFTLQSQVLWNQDPLTTHYVDSGTLIAFVTADEIANPNTALITVEDPSMAVVSDAQRFVVTQTSTVYFPEVAVGGGYATVFTLINNSTQNAAGTLTLTAQDGTPLLVASSDAAGAPVPASSFAVSIPGGGTRTITVTAPNPGDPVTSGWAYVDSNNSSLTGEAIFETSQSGVLTSVAGVLPAPPAHSVTIPLDDDAAAGRQTGIAIANQTANAVNIKMMVFDENGAAVESIRPPQLNPLSPGQQVAEFVDAFLPGRATFRGSLVLVGNGPDDQFVSAALLINAGLTAQGLMSAFPVDVLRGTTVKPSTTYFPQVAVGGPYSTSVTLLNAGTQDATGSLTVYGQDGNPFTVSSVESGNAAVAGSTFSFLIPAGGSRTYTLSAVDPDAPTESGWIRVDSSSNMLTGVATLQTAQNDVLTSIAGVLPANPAHAATIPFDNDAAAGRRMGFALANGGGSDINVQIEVLDEDGNEITVISPPQMNPLGPGQQIAKFVDELLPELATFKGSIKLVGLGADDQFESLALELTPGLTGWGLMTVIPIFQ